MPHQTHPRQADRIQESHEVFGQVIDAIAVLGALGVPETALVASQSAVAGGQIREHATEGEP
jgi:hypothetical protein